MRRQSILLELAIESLIDEGRPEGRRALVSAAAREDITLFELVRERLLLKAGLAIGAHH